MVIESTKLKEHKRTYVFPSGTISYDNVIGFAMPGSTHRLTLADGKHVVVAPGWVAIEIEGIDGWSF